MTPDVPPHPKDIWLFRCDTCGRYVRCFMSAPNKNGNCYLVEDGHISDDEAVALTLAGCKSAPYTDCKECAATWRRDSAEQETELTTWRRDSDNP